MPTYTKCPKCEKNSLYTRVDGSQRCGRCGYDTRKDPKPEGAKST
jgi:ribosomal protein S27AE